MAFTCTKCLVLFNSHHHHHHHSLRRSLRLQLWPNLIQRSFFNTDEFISRRNISRNFMIKYRRLYNVNNWRNFSTNHPEQLQRSTKFSLSSSIVNIVPSLQRNYHQTSSNEEKKWRENWLKKNNWLRRRRRTINWQLLFGCIGGGVGGLLLLFYYYYYYLHHQSDGNDWISWRLAQVEAKTVPNLTGRRQKFNFIADVVDLCADSVVYIEIKDMRIFDYFAGKPATASNGSGFIIESDGTILTNAHVVINKPHTMVQVRLHDGRTFPGVVEDVDQTSDLAIVRIKCKNLPVMRLGTSSNLRSGEWVLALGSPLALSNTVTAGVISSTQRPSQELGLHNRDINYLQTDAAITFGNSGGPLVNLDGEAIGVNSMKVTAGISFAIPIDYVKLFLRKVEERRKRGSTKNLTQSSKRYMGITMLTLTTDILNELRMRSDHFPANLKHGVLVWKVVLRSPADIGGLMPGDIVTHINRKQIKSSSDVYDALSESVKSLNLTILRGDKQLNITIEPEDPDDYEELLHK